MLIEIKALQQDLPALGSVGTKDLCELLASLGFPVDAVEESDGSTVLDVDVTANRGDVLSHRGLARDIAARLAADLSPLPVKVLTEGAPLRPVRLESEVPAINGRVVTFDTKQFASLSHGYAMTVHKAQGQGLAAITSWKRAG